MLFQHRAAAGRELATELLAYAWHPNVLVLGLPRGGVPVAFEVAKALHVPLDVLLVRKLGVPGQEELAMGTLASGGVRLLNREVVQSFGISVQIITAVTAREQQELARRERFYRGDHPAPVLRGHRIILVDDGVATGATMRAAIAAVRHQRPDRLMVAIPVAAPAVYQALRAEVDELICLLTPDTFLSVEEWYEHFPAISDQQVLHLLERSRQILVVEQPGTEACAQQIRPAGRNKEEHLLWPCAATSRKRRDQHTSRRYD